MQHFGYLVTKRKLEEEDSFEDHVNRASVSGASWRLRAPPYPPSSFLLPTAACLLTLCSLLGPPHMPLSLLPPPPPFPRLLPQKEVVAAVGDANMRSLQQGDVIQVRLPSCLRAAGQRVCLPCAVCSVVFAVLAMARVQRACDCCYCCDCSVRLLPHGRPACPWLCCNCLPCTASLVCSWSARDTSLWIGLSPRMRRSNRSCCSTSPTAAPRPCLACPELGSVRSMQARHADKPAALQTLPCTGTCNL